MEAPERGELLDIAMEGPGQQSWLGGDCVPKTGDQQPSREEEVHEKEGQPGDEEQQQETREVHGEDEQQQRKKEEGPMTEKQHSNEEVHGVEGQQPNSEEEQGPGDQWQRKDEVLGTEEQQGVVQEQQRREKVPGTEAHQQRKGDEAEVQQGEMHGPDEPQQRMGEVNKAGDQQLRKEEALGAKEQLPRWRDVHGEEGLELSRRAEIQPYCRGQQKYELEKEIHQDSAMKGQVLQDTLGCRPGPQEMLTTEKEHSWVKGGQESRIKEMVGSSGIEEQWHPNMKEDETRQTWMAELPEGPPGIEAEQERKSWTKDQEEARTLSTSTQCAYVLTSDNMLEVKQLEETIEEMLMRLDEFCGMADMVRNETSQLLEEDIHAIKAKVEEMNKVYTKVDKLEAFVKMVGRHVTFLEEQLVQAERDHQPFTHLFHKILQSASVPSFIYKHSTAKQQPYELPELFRTEEYIPLGYMATQSRKT